MVEQITKDVMLAAFGQFSDRMFDGPCPPVIRGNKVEFVSDDHRRKYEQHAGIKFRDAEVII